MHSRTVTVNDRMQQGYRYDLVARAGRDFDPEFRPELTPQQMLRLGVFCGKYMTDTRDEFPRAWFTGARLASGRRNCSLNFFGVDASQPLSVWRKKGWIHRDDPRGWFQWYCRGVQGNTPTTAAGATTETTGNDRRRVSRHQHTLRGAEPRVSASRAGAPAGDRQPVSVSLGRQYVG